MPRRCFSMRTMTEIKTFWWWAAGCRHDAGDASYRHRLYINDGKGAFSPAPKDALPAVKDGASCVVVADFDGDGLPDVFLGAGSVPGRYPLFSESHLWLNRGGKFVDATPPGLRRPGIVTAALACDVDGDGKLDLMLTTAWGPVRYFHNESAGLTERTTEVGLDRAHRLVECHRRGRSRWRRSAGFRRGQPGAEHRLSCHTGCAGTAVLWRP